jgi:hypothetical protein
MSEIDITQLYALVSVITTKQDSMCESLRNIEKRLSNLEEAEHKRKGATALLLAMLAAASATGAVIMKYFV